MAPDVMSPEEAFVRAFVLQDQRRRLLWLLKQGAKRRGDFLDHLHRGIALDERFARLLRGRESLAPGLERLLRSKGSPDEVYVVAADPDIDMQRMPLNDAIRALVDTMDGGLISCIPGRLAHYQASPSEHGGNDYLLERTT